MRVCILQLLRTLGQHGNRVVKAIDAYVNRVDALLNGAYGVGSQFYIGVQQVKTIELTRCLLVVGRNLILGTGNLLLGLLAVATHFL